MTDQFTDRLSEYLDGLLPDAERESLELHLVDCADCRTTLADLRRVVARARGATDRAPGDLWPGIAARIGATGTPVVPIERARTRRGVLLTVPQLAAAAVLLIALSGGAAWALLAARSPAPSAPVAAAPVSGVVRTAASGLPARAELSYSTAVSELERTLAAGRGRLSPRTVAVLEANLARIDQAIADARKALAADPANAYLNAHLADAMRQKIDLLQRAAVLADAAS